MGIVTTIAPIALALIMLGLGASLTIKDFTRVCKNPKEFLIGLTCQLILLPIIAYLLIIILRTPIELSLGVMLIAAAPGGVTSNVLTKFADGDVALSISLTAVTSIISIVSVPYVVFLSIELFDITYVKKEVSMLGISLKMFFVVTVPVLIGMVIRKFANNLIINKPIEILLIIFIFLIIKSFANFLIIIPIITGTVTTKNIFKDILSIETSFLTYVMSNNSIDRKTT